MKFLLSWIRQLIYTLTKYLILKLLYSPEIISHNIDFMSCQFPIIKLMLVVPHFQNIAYNLADLSISYLFDILHSCLFVFQHYSMVFQIYLEWVHSTWEPINRFISKLFEMFLSELLLQNQTYIK